MTEEKKNKYKEANCSTFNVVALILTIEFTLFSAYFLGTDLRQYRDLRCIDPYLTSSPIETECSMYNEKFIMIPITKCGDKKAIMTPSKDDNFLGFKKCWYYIGEVHCDEFTKKVIEKPWFRVEFTEPKIIKEHNDYRECTQLKEHYWFLSRMMLIGMICGFIAFMAALLKTMMD